MTELQRALARLSRMGASIQLEGGGTVDRSSYMLLTALGDDGELRLTALAETIGLDKSTVSRILSALEARGLLRRRPDPADGRASLVSLTAEGRRVLTTTQAHRQQELRNVLSSWSADDQARLAELLTRFADDYADSRSRVPAPPVR